MDTAETTLVLGGARSGKSRFAESLATGFGKQPVYLATAQALDGEMAARIATHQQRRDEQWTTVEEPLALAEALGREAHGNRCILVDCLTLWITNLMVAKVDVEAAILDLVRIVSTLAAPVVFVSNEVGQGIVPADSMSRQFRDHSGRCHQLMAAAVDHVFFITAGLPQKLK